MFHDGGYREGSSCFLVGSFGMCVAEWILPESEKGSSEVIYHNWWCFDEMRGNKHPGHLALQILKIQKAEVQILRILAGLFTNSSHGSCNCVLFISC